MNFYDYWMKLSNKEREEIFYQKAIPIKDVKELKRIIDSNEENSLISIVYSTRPLLKALRGNNSVNFYLCSDLTYKITHFYKDGEPQQKTQLVYSINKYKLNYSYSSTPNLYDFKYARSYRGKKWPHNDLEKYFERDSQNESTVGDTFQFLQSQGGFSFKTGTGLNISYWKIVSLFPASKTPFLNWSDSEPWEVKE